MLELLKQDTGDIVNELVLVSIEAIEQDVSAKIAHGTPREMLGKHLNELQRKIRLQFILRGIKQYLSDGLLAIGQMHVTANEVQHLPLPDSKCGGQFEEDLRG